MTKFKTAKNNESFVSPDRHYKIQTNDYNKKRDTFVWYQLRTGGFIRNHSSEIGDKHIYININLLGEIYSIKVSNYPN